MFQKILCLMLFVVVYAVLCFHVLVREKTTEYDFWFLFFC